MTYQRIAIGSGSETEDEAHAVREYLVDDEEEDRGDEHHHEDHGRGDARLLAGRPGHARHFLPDLTIELCGGRFGHDRVRKLPSMTRRRRIPDRAHFTRVAGVEGIEPPTPGFGDRCSTS